MDLELDADEIALRDQARAVLDEQCPPSVVRAVFNGLDNGARLWELLVDQGWSSIVAPAHFGGLALGAVAEAVLAGEAGRVVAPIPFLSTVTQFGALLAESGATEDTLRPIVEGRITATLAIGEAGGCRPDNIETTATEDGGGWRLDGVKLAVPDAATASTLAVIARLPGTAGTDGLGAFRIDPTQPSCTITPIPTIDPTTPLARLSLEGTHVERDAVLLDPHSDASGAAVERVRRHATAMMATSCVATCRALFETTVGYAKNREQFGRPIGGFQAIKHRLADMYLAVERADALCWYGVVCVAESTDDAPVAVAMAKAAAGECRRLVTRDALQLHGGIGFTWEHDLHLWLKRATATAFLYGDVEAQRAELVGLLGLQTTGGRAIA